MKKIGIFYSYTSRGPGKVIQHLIKGLDHLSVNYKINQISDINIFLQSHKLLQKPYSDALNQTTLFLGPNIADLPILGPMIMDTEKYNKCLVPSEWVKKSFSRWIPENKICVWNSGVDHIKYIPKETNKKFDFLVYYKHRPQKDLDFVINFLQNKKYTYTIIEYDKYDDNIFRQKIAESKYGFIIDNTETQGIAIQEMMSCNLPLLVWDKNLWTNAGHHNSCAASSVPYFDNTCGEKFDSEDQLEATYDKFISSKSQYSPREYILSHCNYITETKKLLDIILYKTG